MEKQIDTERGTEGLHEEEGSGKHPTMNTPCASTLDASSLQLCGTGQRPSRKLGSFETFLLWATFFFVSRLPFGLLASYAILWWQDRPLILNDLTPWNWCGVNFFAQAGSLIWWSYVRGWLVREGWLEQGCTVPW